MQLFAIMFLPTLHGPVVLAIAQPAATGLAHALTAKPQPWISQAAVLQTIQKVATPKRSLLTDADHKTYESLPPETNIASVLLNIFFLPGVLCSWF